MYENIALLSSQVDRFLQTASLLGPVSGIGSDAAKSQGPNRPNIFFVDPTTGLTTGDGRDPRRPLSTLQAAIDLCERLRGDIIVVARGGHVPTAAIDVDKRGITIVADHYGGNRQNMDEHWIIANASYTSGPVLEITQGCRIIGLAIVSRFATGPSVRATVDSGTGASANYLEMVDCGFPGWGIGKDGVEFRGANLGRIYRCSFADLANSGSGVVFRGSGTNFPVQVEVEDCKFKDCTAGLEVISGASPQDLWIHRNRFKGCTDDVNFNGGATGHGLISDNYHDSAVTAAHDDTVTNLIAAGDFEFVGNHYAET